MCHRFAPSVDVVVGLLRSRCCRVGEEEVARSALRRCPFVYKEGGKGTQPSNKPQQNLPHTHSCHSVGAGNWMKSQVLA
jgi:hypothetical protein